MHLPSSRASKNRSSQERQKRDFAEKRVALIDMTMLNGISRYHLCIEAMRRATRLRALTPPLIAECNDMLSRHHAYVRANLEDMPEIRDWVWTD